MTRRRIALLAAAAFVILLVLCGLLWRETLKRPAPRSSPVAGETDLTILPDTPSSNGLAPTSVRAHNLKLRKGPDFRVYIRWIRGQMLRTHKQVNPSFDDPESFVLQIQKGVIRVNIGDIGNYLNANSPPNTPLRKISIEPDGEQVKLHGTLHKFIPLPVEVVGSLLPTPEGHIRFHVAKIDLLKLPVKGLLGGFHIQLSDLVHTGNMKGIQLTGNDIIFDTQTLLPPPHIHGELTAVLVRPPDLEVIYGNAIGNSVDDEIRLAHWHNFLRLTGGTLDFGKLTMHDVDLTMIDASQDPWFDLDLVNYQAQLVNGYTRMTAQAGLEIFMPDLDERTPRRVSQSITMEWLKNRNRSLPADIPVK